MAIKNKISFCFLLPSIFVVITTTVFCFCCTTIIVKKNTFYQLERIVEGLSNKTNICLSAKQGRTLDFSSDNFIRDYIEGIVRSDSERACYIKELYPHLATNTPPPLDLGILELFVVDLNDVVIRSADINLLDRDDSDQTYCSKALKDGSCINYLHYSPEFRHNAFLI